MNPKIPKRIIQTSKDLTLPLHAKAAVVNVKLLNSDFEYLFFNDEQVEMFIEQHFPEYQSVFRSFSYPIQRIDFFRYLAIYQLGGFYFDLDVILASGLDSLLDFSCVFPFEKLTINSYLRRELGMDWEIGNYAFGAAAGHPFLGEIIKNCIKAQKNPEWAWPMIKSIPRFYRERYLVLSTTGPGLVSRTLAEYPEAAQQVKVLFPEKVWDRSKWHQFGSYGIHLMEGTWIKQKGALLSRLIRIWDRWKIKRVIKAGKIIGDTRSLEFRKKACTSLKMEN